MLLVHTTTVNVTLVNPVWYLLVDKGLIKFFSRSPETFLKVEPTGWDKDSCGSLGRAGQALLRWGNLQESKDESTLLPVYH